MKWNCFKHCLGMENNQMIGMRQENIIISQMGFYQSNDHKYMIN